MLSVAIAFLLVVAQPTERFVQHEGVRVGVVTDEFRANALVSSREVVRSENLVGRRRYRLIARVNRRDGSIDWMLAGSVYHLGSERSYSEALLPGGRELALIAEVERGGCDRSLGCAVTERFRVALPATLIEQYSRGEGLRVQIVGRGSQFVAEFDSRTISAVRAVAQGRARALNGSNGARPPGD